MAEKDEALPQAAQNPPSPGRRSLLSWALTALAAVGCGTLVGIFLYNPPPNGTAGNDPSQHQGDPPPQKLFAGWTKPDVVFFLSGEMHGYLQPCGCSEPQYGGLVRRYNFLKSLSAKGWPIVAVDLGDIARGTGRQALLKYATAMEALRQMNYTAIGIGKSEFQLSLLEAVAEYTLQQEKNAKKDERFPRILATNLEDRQKDGVFFELVEGAEVARQPAVPKVGVMSIVAPSVAKTVKDPAIRFVVDAGGKFDNATAIGRAMVELQAKKADSVVMLYEGTIKEARAVAGYCQKLAAQYPKLPVVRVVLCLSEDPEPPGITEVVGDTQLVWVGQKGRYVGVLGGYRGKAGQPWQWKYQVVKIGPEFDTPKGQEKTHPLMQLMESYAQKVKESKLVAAYLQSDHPVQQAFKGVKPKYVGSKRCMDCHPSAYKVWSRWEKDLTKHSHAHAYETLEKLAINPSQRQFDPECVSCHVVGFGKTGGFTGPELTTRLKNVGCESCHGPCSEHVKDPTDSKWYPHINPLRADEEERTLAAKKAKVKLNAQEAARLNQVNVQRMRRMDRFCQSCHDIDNDVNWKFDKRWPEIIHMTPAEERAKRNRPQAQTDRNPPPPVVGQGISKKK
jgi:hypothetical protein